MEDGKFVDRYPYFSVNYRQPLQQYVYMYQGGGEPLVILKDYMPAAQMMELYKDTRHTHDFYELTYIRHGAGTHILNGERYTIQQGDLFFLRPGDIHTYYPDMSSGAFCVINCLFPSLPGDFSALGKTPEGRIVLHMDAVEDFTQLFVKMDGEFDRREPGYQDMIQSYFRIALITLIRSLGGESPTLSLRELLPVKAYIDAHYASLDLRSCAAYTAYSRSHFCRLFRECFGVTLTQYINRRKVAAAKALLAGTDLPVEEILCLSGFHNKNYFYRVFQTHVRQTPTAFRAEQRRSIGG